MQKGQWGRCHHAQDTHGALIGKQEDGSFNTAKTKVYPHGMNEILAKAMFQFAVEYDSSQLAQRLPDEILPYTEQQFMDHGIIQPDFHGGPYTGVMYSCKQPSIVTM